jgi:hypothetical protein
MASLVGMFCLLGGIWFLFGMPILAATGSWGFYKKNRTPAVFVVAAVMLVVFYLTAGLMWLLLSIDWNLSFLSTFEATINPGKYGLAVTHRAEVILISLLIVSTLAAVAAAAVAAGIARSRIKRQSAAA